MGISKLVKTIIDNIIDIEIIPQDNNYAFALLNVNQGNKKILVSAPKYNSKKEARKEGKQFIYDLKTLNFKDVSDPI